MFARLRETANSCDSPLTPEGTEGKLPKCQKKRDNNILQSGVKKLPSKMEVAPRPQDYSYHTEHKTFRRKKDKICLNYFGSRSGLVGPGLLRTIMDCLVEVDSALKG